MHDRKGTINCSATVVIVRNVVKRPALKQRGGMRIQALMRCFQHHFIAESLCHKNSSRLDGPLDCATSKNLTYFYS